MHARARLCVHVIVFAYTRVSVCACVRRRAHACAFVQRSITFQRHARYVVFCVLLYVILSPLREGHGMTSSRCIAISDPEGCVRVHASA